MNSKDSSSERQNGLIGLDDLILIFVTCFAAPLAAHFCDLIVGSEQNPYTAEKLLAAYFASISGFVLYRQLVWFLRKANLWDKGWRLGNSDALVSMTCIICVAVALSYYDTLGGTVAILGLLIAAISVLWCNPGVVILDARKMSFFALLTAVAVPSTAVLGIGSNPAALPQDLLLLWVTQFLVCVVFDAAGMVARKAIRGRKR